MASQDEKDSQGILLAELSKIPGLRVIVLVAAGFSGIFSGAWWIGLDSAPDRWTGTQAKETHTRQDAEVFAVRADLEEAERHLWTLQIQHAELIKRYERLEVAVHGHHEASVKWIERIESNTQIILDNQKKAHEH